MHSYIIYLPSADPLAVDTSTLTTVDDGLLRSSETNATPIFSLTVYIA